MQKRFAGLIGILVAATLLATPVSANGCGSVTIAEINWASAELMANVDAFILENGYDCEVELVPGATMQTFTSMNEKGQPDIAWELWVNAFRKPLDQALDEGRLHPVVSGPISGLGEGWWVPSYTLEQNPELQTIEVFLERADLFPHPEDSSKGAFYGCPAG